MMRFRFLYLLMTLCLASCAHRERVRTVPAFTPPSSATVKQSVTHVREAVAKATEHATKASSAVAASRVTVAHLETAIPAASPFVAELRLQLDGAATELDALSAQLLEAKNGTLQAQTRLVVMDSKIAEQTEVLNSYAERNNKLTVENAKLADERDRWKRITFRWRLWALGALLAAGLWIFKGPIFAFARHAVGIPL